MTVPIWEPHYEDKTMRESDPPTTFDWTLRSTFRACPRKFYWFNRGADYISIPAYFTAGRVWQIMLDTWYTPQVVKGMSSQAIVEKMQHAIGVGRSVWEEEGTLGFKDNTMENMEELFKHYVGTYPIEPFRVIGSEKGWEWPITGTPYMLGGSLDAYVEWEPYGYLVMENKTSGVYLTDQYIAQYNFSGQVTQYTWFLTQLKGEEVFGCLVNMACKRIPKRKTPDNLFARDLQKRDEFELDEFLEGMLLDIADIEREWERWIWPKTTNALQCTGGIGLAPCLFKNICLQKIKPWDIDPLAYEGIKWREEEWKPWARN